MIADLPTMRAAVATFTMLGCCAALAGGPADDGPRYLTISGFGTLGAARSNNDQADFTANVLNPGNAGYSHPWSAAVDSRVGAQLDLNFDSRWSAVLQLVSERTRRDGYAPSVEWANLQYRATPDLSLRIGRIALPLFLAGDYRKAGYALPWVRTPVELYSAIPVSSSDGVDASYRWQAGAVNNVTQVFRGRSEVMIAPGARALARGLSGLSNTTTAGALTLRASVMSASLTVDVTRPLFDGFSRFGPAGAALVERYDLTERRSRVASIGFNYDPGAWFAMGEVARLRSRSYLGDTSAAYLSAGYRCGDFTPYLVYSAAVADMETSTPGLDLRGLPAWQAGMGQQLNTALNQLLAEIPRQHSVSAGARWDFHPNFALKLQYDRVLPQQGSTGTFINAQQGFRGGQPVTVLSAALDFVF